MQNFMGLGRGLKLILGFFFAVLIFVGAWIFISNRDEGDQITVPTVPEGVMEYTIDERPTDFVKAGVITANNPGLGQDTLYLIYEEPGKPALKKEIVMDTLSICGGNNGALPCMAMSVSFDVAFAGKRAVVEAIKDGEDAVILRKMTVVEEGQEPRLNEPGSIFVPWPYAASLIRSCNVSNVMQTHALDVYITIKDTNQRVRAVEPMIDEVFRVFDEVRQICPQIPLATE